MAINLVSKILETVTPALVARVASGLGLGDASTQKAISAAVPSLIAALISLVSKPQGATKLSDAVAKQEPGALSSLLNAIGGSGQQAAIDTGSNALTSLLGGKTVSALAGAVGQYAGVGDSGSKGLLGLLGPAVLGMLGQQQRDKGLDAAGLAKFLASQKDNAVAALPSGFSKYLDEAGLVDDVTRSATTAASKVQQSTPPSILPWLLGALALLAIGALVWRLSAPPREAAETPSAKIEAPYAGLFAKLRGIKAGDVDIGDLTTSAVNDLYASLSGVKDEVTAKAALPDLTKAQSEFDRLSGALGQLSPEARKTLAETFASIRPNLDQLLDKVLALPGVGAVIKPVVDAIRSKFDTLTAT